MIYPVTSQHDRIYLAGVRANRLAGTERGAVAPIASAINIEFILSERF